MIAHSGLIHALYGGFFGWLGVFGALLPDIIGLVGWAIYLRALSVTRGQVGHESVIALGWYGHMPEWAKAWYYVMHSLPAAGIVCTGEMLIRLAMTQMAQGYCTVGDMVPWFGIGYLTHVLSDWVTHRQDIASPLLRYAGRMFGVNWWETRYYWTEWAAFTIVVLAMGVTGQINVVMELVAACVGSFLPW